jgi:2-keto-4-pentenoate hydratase/2-oxohepta-3-ene-1,7-dioic acid hydratase in catechol pathway
VTRDEFGELRDQSVVVRVNNEERLRDRYRTMVFESPWVPAGQRALWSFPEMVECLSRSQPIQACEVWGSGTIPGGCELERGDRARYLKPGDRVEIEIEGIGVLTNSIANA